MGQTHSTCIKCIGNGESTQHRGNRGEARSRGIEAGSAALLWTTWLPELWLMRGQGGGGLGGTAALAGFEAPSFSCPTLSKYCIHFGNIFNAAVSEKSL